MSDDPKSRKRNAEGTRAAILASARRAFAEAGYDGAGLRGIAEGAGVTAMMVNRYFGSKEQLFAEVVADSMGDPVILSAANRGSDQMARDFARALVGLSTPGAPALDGFRIMWKSGASEVASAIARDQIMRIHQASAEGLVAGDHARQRAALFLALVAGVQLMRQQIALPALAEVDPEVLADLLTPLIAQLLGPQPADPVQ